MNIFKKLSYVKKLKSDFLTCQNKILELTLVLNSEIYEFNYKYHYLCDFLSFLRTLREIEKKISNLEKTKSKLTELEKKMNESNTAPNFKKYADYKNQIKELEDCKNHAVKPDLERYEKRKNYTDLFGQLVSKIAGKPETKNGYVWKDVPDREKIEQINIKICNLKNQLKKIPENKLYDIYMGIERDFKDVESSYFSDVNFLLRQDFPSLKNKGNQIIKNYPQFYNQFKEEQLNINKKREQMNNYLFDYRRLKSEIFNFKKEKFFYMHENELPDIVETCSPELITMKELFNSVRNLDSFEDSVNIIRSEANNDQKNRKKQFFPPKTTTKNI